MDIGDIEDRVLEIVTSQDALDVLCDMLPITDNSSLLFKKFEKKLSDLRLENFLSDVSSYISNLLELDLSQEDEQAFLVVVTYLDLKKVFDAKYSTDFEMNTWVTLNSLYKASLQNNKTLLFHHNRLANNNM